MNSNDTIEDVSSQSDPKSAYVMAVYEKGDGEILELKRL